MADPFLYSPGSVRGNRFVRVPRSDFEGIFIPYPGFPSNDHPRHKISSSALQRHAFMNRGTLVTRFLPNSIYCKQDWGKRVDRDLTRDGAKVRSAKTSSFDIQRTAATVGLAAVSVTR